MPTVYTRGGLEALSRVVGDGGSRPLEVHLKVDTGMHRVGADAEEAPGLAAAVATDPRLAAGRRVDPPGRGRRRRARSTGSSPLPQLDRFDALLARLAASGHRPPMTHVANSAAAIGVPAARRDLVRCGIALYGVAPTPALADELAAATGGQRLRPGALAADPGDLRPRPRVR